MAGCLPGSVSSNIILWPLLGLAVPAVVTGRKPVDTGVLDVAEVVVWTAVVVAAEDAGWLLVVV